MATPISWNNNDGFCALCREPYDSWSKHAEQTEAKISKLEGVGASLSSKLCSVSDVERKLESQNADLQAKISELDANVASLTRKLNNASAKIVQLETENTELHATISQLESLFFYV